MDLTKVTWNDAPIYGAAHFTEDSKQNLTNKEIELFQKPLSFSERVKIHDLLTSIQFPSKTSRLLEKEGRTAEQIMNTIIPLENPKRRLLKRSGITGKPRRVRVIPLKAQRVKRKDD
jgi:hypothetical protein